MRFKKFKILTSIFSLVGTLGLNAAEFYVAPTGKSSNNGSINSPWDLQTALNHPSSVKPGDTIWLRNGTHRINNHITKFTSRLQGSSSAPITVRQYPGERATVDGNILQNTGGWVNYWGFEILNSNTDRYTTQTGPWPTDWNLTFDGKTSDYCVSGFDLQAPNVKLINLVIHDSIGGGIGVNIPAQNSEIYGCLSYYNGWQAPDRAHGHGIYAQNATPYTKHIKETMFFGNLGSGFQVTGTGPSSVADNFKVEGNAIFQNGSMANKHQANFMFGAYQGSMKGATAIGNFIYDTGAGALSADANIGYSGGSSGAIVKDNVFGTSITIGGASGLTASGNIFASSVSGISKSSYPNNTFAKPTQNIVSVRPNQYEAGRGNIIVYNYQMQNSVNVSLAGLGLNNGDQYELRNVQNFYGDIITGTYNGSSITIPMTGRTVAKPIGSNFSTPASTFPAFGAFVIMKKSGGTTQPPLTNAAPTISSIAAVTVSAGTAAGPLNFTVGDKETAAGSLTVTASSSNTSLVPNANIVLGGSGANRTVRVAPAANQTGSATISIKVSDGTNTTTTTFGITVTAVGGGSTNKVQVAFEAESGSITAPMTVVSGSHIWTTAADQGSVSYSVDIPQTDTYYIWAKILAPTFANDSFFVSVDGQEDVFDAAEGKSSPDWQWSLVNGRNGGAPLSLNPRTFSLSQGKHTVVIRGRELQSGIDKIIVTNDKDFVPSNVNVAPTISAIAAQSTAHNTATAPIAFTIGDTDTPVGSLAVTATSSSQTLVPDSKIVLGGTGANRTVTVTPATNQSGTATITVKVSDGLASATRSFVLTVAAAVNTKPVISTIADQSVAAGASTAAIGFTVSDKETAAASLTLTAASSNTGIVPNANIILGGSGTNRTIALKSITNQTGVANITVTVNDGTLTASTSFGLTVTNSTSGNTNTNVVDGITIGFEAESGSLVAPMTVVSNSYIWTTTPNQGTATYTVDIPKAGTYYIWAKILAPHYANDSFFVSVDGQEDVFDAAEGKQKAEWQWSQVNGRDGKAPLTLNPRTFNLSQGKHTIVIGGREAQAGVDKIVVTSDKNFAPDKNITAVADTITAFPGQPNQIPAVDLLRNDTTLFQDELTIKSVSTPANGTAVLSSNAVIYTPKAGFTGADKFTYTVGNGDGASSTADVTVNVTAPEKVHLGLEAEAGVLAAPMGVMTDSKVTTRKFIQTTGANTGTATYTIDIPKTDTYTIWCKILGASYASDSFFVSVDGKDDVFDAAEGKQSPDFQWSQVNGRNGGAPLALSPRTFELTQGKHTIVIRGREVAAGLDRIVITSDSDYVPADLTVVADTVSALANTAKLIVPSDLLKNDIALFDDTLTITAVGSAQNGTAVLSSGSITYTPKPGYVGKDTFTYTVTDGQGGTATGTVTVNVGSIESAQPTS